MLLRLSTLGLLALANASPVEKRVNFDMVMKGPYSVVNCKENTNVVVNLLDKLRSSLVPVIEDAKAANPSAAYQAFFKDPSYAPFVSTLLQNISTGVSMLPPETYSFNGGASFLCVDAPGQFAFTLDGPRDAYNDCINNPSTTTNYVGFAPPKPFIILCPSFFTRNIAPVPPPNTCLTVNTYINRFRGSGQKFWLYQMWILLRMLTHYYLFTSSSVIDISNKDDVNSCFRLGAKQSSLRTSNYVYYAASVYGQCRDFPTANSDGRELLEVDVPDPAAHGLDFHGPTAVEFLATDLRLGMKNATGSP